MALSFTVIHTPLIIISLAGSSWIDPVYTVYGSQLWAKKGSRGGILAAPPRLILKSRLVLWDTWLP